MNGGIQTNVLAHLLEPSDKHASVVDDCPRQTRVELELFEQPDDIRVLAANLVKWQADGGEGGASTRLDGMMGMTNDSVVLASTA